MIKRINHIRNFGVFNSYRRSGDVQDFSKVNIIYGWNYSGKTTVSRVFQCFEHSKVNPHYPNAEFEIEDCNDRKGNQTNLLIENQEIRVFNSDFVRDNIHLEGESFNPILLLGEDTKKAEDQIKLKQEKLDKINKLFSNLKKEGNSTDKFIQDGLTQLASTIKDSLQIVQAYTRTHVKPTLDEIKSNHKAYIKSSKDAAELLKKATVTENDKLATLQELKLDLKFLEIIEEAKILLNVVPQFSNTIQYFIDNPEIANWIEIGLPIHQKKSNCEFCGNVMSQDRLTEITAHFSEDLKNHKVFLNELIKKIQESKIALPKIQQSDFYREYWAIFGNTDQELKKSIKLYNSSYDKLIKVLELKKNKPFEVITNLDSIENQTESLESNINKFNELICKNNDKTEKFEKEKSGAILDLKRHHIASFIEKISLQKKENKISLYKAREVLAEDLIKSTADQIKQLEAAISKAHKGSEILNEYIQKFLGRDEIQVVVENEETKERFRLKRKESKAVNLSEGEKTAIAFSFFLTKLLESNDLSKLVVYIDDPISSLDSNHIFQVNAVLKDFFFSREKEDDVHPKILNCRQLFLSTHNFEFFSLLRELPTPKDSKTFYYFVKRISSSESKLDKLPKSLQNYSSEYHYLFKLINDFTHSPNKELDDAMILPNAVRRFVEMYTYSRIPGNKDQTVDYRAEKLWGAHESKRILKVCHYFSHGNNIERMGKHNEFICDIEEAIKDLINLLSTHDLIHYNQLHDSVS